MIRRFEARLGVDRSDRSPWVWLIPIGSGITAIVVTDLGPQLGVWQRLPLAVLAAAILTAMSGVYLTAFGGDDGDGGDDSAS